MPFILRCRFFYIILELKTITLRSQKRVGVSRRRGDGAENDGKQRSGWTLRMSRRLCCLVQDTFQCSVPFEFQMVSLHRVQKKPRERKRLRAKLVRPSRALTKRASLGLLLMHRDELRTVIAVHHRVVRRRELPRVQRRHQLHHRLHLLPAALVPRVPDHGENAPGTEDPHPGRHRAHRRPPPRANPLVRRGTRQVTQVEAHDAHGIRRRHRVVVMFVVVVVKIVVKRSHPRNPHVFLHALVALQHEVHARRLIQGERLAHPGARARQRVLLNVERDDPAGLGRVTGR
mmetsp:Transcript_16036/g.62373  ORF Transcript_16036/g.62373 Transcript_16036/m.62373 type:complete len:288 (+) Transcript_16036:657-1520(+)